MGHSPTLFESGNLCHGATFRWLHVTIPKTNYFAKRADEYEQYAGAQAVHEAGQNPGTKYEISFRRCEQFKTGSLAR
jgi:hypothetical protein